MLDVKYSTENLISTIYECQKKIILNSRFIKELEHEGKVNHTPRLKEENNKLQVKINELQKELRGKYHYHY